MPDTWDTILKYLKSGGYRYIDRPMAGYDHSYDVYTGSDKYYLSLWSQGDSICITAYSPLHVRTGKESELALQVAEKNLFVGYYGRFMYYEEAKILYYSLRFVDRGEITNNELAKYFGEVKRCGECLYDEFLDFCYMDKIWNTPFREEREAFYARLGKEELYKDFGCVWQLRKSLRYDTAARLLFSVLENSEELTEAERITAKNNLAFVMRVAKMTRFDIDAPHRYEWNRLLGEGVEAGHIYSIFNLALQKISFKKYDEAVDLMLKLDTCEKWTDLWENWGFEASFPWTKYPLPESDLIFWLWSFVKGDECEEDHENGVKKYYGDFTESEAFGRLLEGLNKIPS